MTELQQLPQIIEIIRLDGKEICLIALLVKRQAKIVDIRQVDYICFDWGYFMQAVTLNAEANLSLSRRCSGNDKRRRLYS